MKRYFTSDLHFGSTNILKYASRPFSSAKEARGTLIANINETCNKSDILFHVGDFMLRGVDRHDEVEDHGLGDTRDVLLQKIKCPVILLSGNHDDTHNCDTHIKKMTIDLGCYRNISVSHFPYVPTSEVFDHLRIHLCGHVHDAWIFRYDSKSNVLNINVGCDAWQFKPVSEIQLIELINQVYKAKNAGVKIPAILPKNKFEDFMKMVKNTIAKNRAIRREEKHLKKGLTPEECERRKQAAMAARGF